MAQQAELHRTSCAEKLTASMRQLRRYIDANTPRVERALRDKMHRVRDDQDVLTAAHHEYGAKAKISVEEADMRNYINPKIDAAVDILDEAEDVIAKLKLTEDAKVEQHEFDVSVAAIESMIVDLRESITKEDTVEADAVYVETVIRDLLEKDNQLTKVSIRVKEMLVDDDDGAMKTEISTKETALHKSVQDCRAKGNKFVATIRSKVTQAIAAQKTTETSVKSSSASSAWRMERTKFPTFSGNPRDFASFKGDFEAIVVPEYPNELHRTYALKENCLKGEAKKLVRNMNDYTSIWERLNDRFGDNIQIVDTIIKDINSTNKKRMTSPSSTLSMYSSKVCRI